MRKFKITLLAALAATTMSLAPMQAAQAAANPVKQCGLAYTKAVSKVLKAIGKGYVQICKGQSETEVANKLLNKYNKVISKLNAKGVKLDCATNADPDLAAAFPFPQFTLMNAQDSLTAAVTFCNGVDD